ncbi:MAG: LamG-like jellyroll fold domain-containing protein, partial [Spirochaetota bacterium]
MKMSVCLLVMAAALLSAEERPAIELLFNGDLKNSGTLGGEAVFDNPLPDEAAKLGGTGANGFLDMSATLGGIADKNEKHGGAVTYPGKLTGNTVTVAVSFAPAVIDDLPRRIVSMAPLMQIYSERGQIICAVMNSKNDAKWLSVRQNTAPGTALSIAVVIDTANDEMRAYENSAGTVKLLTRVKGLPPNAAVSGGNTVIGNVGGSRPFKGRIDSVRVWMRALSESEIAPVLRGEDISAIALPAAPSSSSLKPSAIGDDASAAVTLTLTSSAPSGIAFIGEKASLTAVISNGRSVPRTFSLLLRVTNDIGETEDIERSIAASASGTTSISVPVASASAGYTSFRAELREAGAVVSRKESALAVVHTPRNFAKRDANTFFGLGNSHFNAEASARIGVRNHRQWMHMAAVKPGMSEDGWKQRDEEMASVRGRGMNVILTLEVRDEMLPPWTGWKSIADAATPEGIVHWRNFVRAVAERYKDKVIGFELINEPDNVCWHYNKYTLEKGASIYAALLKAGAEEIRAAAPGVPVLGIDVSGRDYNATKNGPTDDVPGGFLFSKAVLEKAADAIDVYTGHPYSHGRNFRPGVMAQTPDEMNFRGLHLEVSDMLKKTGRPIRQWTSEIGWAIAPGLALMSDENVRFGAVIAQALTYMRSVPGFEKAFWFIFHWHNWQTQLGENYGLFWCEENHKKVRASVCPLPLYPSPSAAAYATTSYFLEHARPVREVTIAD